MFKGTVHEPIKFRSYDLLKCVFIKGVVIFILVTGVEKSEPPPDSKFLEFFFPVYIADFLSHMGKVVLPREELSPGAQDL